MVQRGYIEQDKYAEIIKLIAIPCTALVIINNHRALIVKRAEEPSIDEWYLPGGRIHKQHTIEQSALDTAHREVGLNCEFGRIIGVYDYFSFTSRYNTDIHSIDIVCLLSTQNEKVKLDNTLSRYFWTYSPEKYLSKHLDNIMPKIIEAVETGH